MRNLARVRSARRPALAAMIAAAAIAGSAPSTASAIGIAVGPDQTGCTLAADPPSFSGDTVYSTAILSCGPATTGRVTGTLTVCAHHLWRIGLAPTWIGPCTSTPVTFRFGAQPAFGEATDSCVGQSVYRTYSYAVLYDSNGNPFPPLRDESPPVVGPCDVRVS